MTMLLASLLPICALSPDVHPAEVLRIVDGDTVEVRLDIGFGIELHENARLWGINAPERYQLGGPEATAYLKTMIAPGQMIFARKMGRRGRDKYGRLLIVIYDSNCRDINQEMVDTGHAVEYLR